MFETSPVHAPPASMAIPGAGRLTVRCTATHVEREGHPYQSSTYSYAVHDLDGVEVGVGELDTEYPPGDRWAFKQLIIDLVEDADASDDPFDAMPRRRQPPPVSAWATRHRAEIAKSFADLRLQRPNQGICDFGI